MPPATGTSDELAVFRHESGAEMPKRAIGYAARHGVVRVEGSVQDETIHLNGYRYEREERPADRPPSRLVHPWPRTVLSRTDIAELCDVTEREASGDRFDYAGDEAGQLYVAYDDDPERLGRDMDTEERVYAVPEYQRSLVEFPISHLSARVADDGRYRIYGYNPDGPSAAARTL